MVKERETVMDLVMVVNMMDIRDVKETLYVAPTTARSLAHTTMRRMIVVRSPVQK